MASPRRGVVSKSSHAARTSQITLGVLAARSRAIVDKADRGLPLSERNLRELANLKRALDGTLADVGNDPPIGSKASERRSLAAIGLTLSTAEAARTQAKGRVEPMPADAVAFLTRISSDLDQVIKGQKLSSPDLLVGFLNSLTRAVDSATAKRGETLIRTPA